ncbi:MAG TPA: ATP-binding cassette domain-containing protein [Puia sp.]|nr:ATP-binding cassette domain-containing protein [Puia sp.]HVW59623.1 ATP-binding cassette domain-containing protein [Puia sp.]
MVKIRDLTFSYRKKSVFRELNLDLRSGHIYGLLGRNGTGKSTLLRNMAGFLFPQGGSIDILGTQPQKRQPSFLGKVFLLPEEFYLPPIGVEQWVKHNAPFYPLFNRQQFDRLVADFDIPGETSLHEMSYGQQKKLLITFALATNAALLLMDEPTNGLDIISKSQFRKVIAGALDEGRCILISTHQVQDLESLIDEVIIIDDGRILFHRSIEAIARELQFKTSRNPEETDLALYSESSLQGHRLVCRNPGGGESHPDLEMLYKAVVANSKDLNAVFIR